MWRRTRMPWGRHKEQLLTDLPSDYLLGALEVVLEEQTERAP